ncbi:MAG: DMT family transporter [Gammaproteobacteria bacterium]|nr:DMT family transporter [Gammaproteobacteria bacterium]
MVFGTLFLTAHDAVSKWLTQTYHLGEVMAYRSIPSLVILCIALALSEGRRGFISNVPRLNASRALLGTLTSFLVVGAYSILPLADALAVIFASPLFVTAFAALLLGETVGRARWVAVLVGFVGMLLMIRPSAGVLVFGSGLAIAAACAAALRDIVTRRIGERDSATNVLFFTTLVSLLAGAVTLPFSAVLPPLADWGLFCVAGCLATAAHWLVIRAFQFAEASLVAPLRFLAIVYAAVFGYFFFGELPGVMQVFGATVIICAAMYVVRAQR